MDFVGNHLGSILARSKSFLIDRQRVDRTTHIVRMDYDFGMRCGGNPAIAMDIIVVGTGIDRRMVYTDIGVVGRDGPSDINRRHRATETQKFGCIVHSVATLEPDALKVDRHHDFFTRIGIVAVNPDFIVTAVHRFCPNLIE